MLYDCPNKQGIASQNTVSGSGHYEYHCIPFRSDPNGKGIITPYKCCTVAMYIAVVEFSFKMI